MKKKRIFFKDKKFMQREKRNFLIFLFVLFCIEVMPSLFSFGRTSEFYVKHYQDMLPFRFFWVLIGLYLVGFLIKASTFYLKDEDRPI